MVTTVGVWFGGVYDLPREALFERDACLPSPGTLTKNGSLDMPGDGDGPAEQMLELESISDRLIGSQDTGGLSLEQRKRTTLGVELAANPSLIFLDEPTSGLDARSAQVRSVYLSSGGGRWGRSADETKKKQGEKERRQEAGTRMTPRLYGEGLLVHHPGMPCSSVLESDLEIGAASSVVSRDGALGCL